MNPHAIIGGAMLGIVAAFGLYGVKQIHDRRQGEIRGRIRDEEMLHAIAELHELEQNSYESWQPQYQRRLELIRYVESHDLEVPG